MNSGYEGRRMERITRRQASERGLHKYWNGRTCARGHTGIRYTGTGACIACVAGYARKDRTRRIGTVSNVSQPDEHTITFTLHAEDTPLAKQFIDALRMARLLVPH